MSVAIINIRKEPVYRRDAIEAGLRRLGYGLTSKGHPSDRLDLLCLWNRKRGAEEQAAEDWERRGGTVLVMENGYAGKDRNGLQLYAISVGQHNGAGWFPVSDENRFSALGLEVKPWADRPHGYVLVCGQRGIGSTMMASPPQWAEKVVKRLSAGSNIQKLKHRPHPGNFAPKTLLTDDLKQARGCMIWSSASGVRALIEGVPVSYAAPHWICSASATRYTGKDTVIFLADDDARQQALHRMSHGQWTVDEIASGEPFKRILDNLEIATWP